MYLVPESKLSSVLCVGIYVSSRIERSMDISIPDFDPRVRLVFGQDEEAKGSHFLRIYFYDSRDKVKLWTDRVRNEKVPFSCFWVQDDSHKQSLCVFIDRELSIRFDDDHEFYRCCGLGLKREDWNLFLNQVSERMDSNDQIDPKLQSLLIGDLDTSISIEISCFWVSPSYVSPRTNKEKLGPPSIKEHQPFPDFSTWKDSFLQQKHKQDRDCEFHSDDDEEETLLQLYRYESHRPKSSDRANDIR